MKNMIKKMSIMFLAVVLLVSTLPIAASAEAAFTLPEVTVGKSLVDVDFTNGSVTAIPEGWTDQKPSGNYGGWDINKNVTKTLTQSGLKLTSSSCDGALFLPAYEMDDYVFEVDMTLNASTGSMGIAINTAANLSTATGSTKMMAYSLNNDYQYLYYQNKYTDHSDSASHKLLREPYGIPAPAAGSQLSYKAYVIDGICYFYLNEVPIVSFEVACLQSESRVAIFTCGADITVTSVKLNRLNEEVIAESGYDNIDFVEGDVLFETDFEGSEYVPGKIPAGWWSAYSGKDGLSYGWNHTNPQTLTVGVTPTDKYGNVFRITTTNADVFTAMPDLEVENYIYEAWIITKNGNNFGIGNEMQGGSAAASKGCAYVTFSSSSKESPKYLKKPSGIQQTNFDYPAGTSRPIEGEINKYTIIHLNGVNYVYYNEVFCTSFAEADDTDIAGLGFYTYGGDLYITEVKVTEVFAPESVNTGYSNLSFAEGDVLLETDFEGNEYVAGKLPAGWWSAYSGKDGLSYGWNHTNPQTLTAGVTQTDNYGKVFRITTTNADVFTAMPDLEVKNYIYEAWIITKNGNNFGIGNEMQGGSAAASKGCAYVTFSSSATESPKYLKKPSGVTKTEFDYPVGTFRPIEGEVNKYTIIHMNGENYIYYNDVYCASFKEDVSSDVAGLGFYTYGGDLYITEVKVTEIYAPEFSYSYELSVDETVGIEIDCDFTFNDIAEENECGVVIKEITKKNENEIPNIETKGAKIYKFDCTAEGNRISAKGIVEFDPEDCDKTLAIVPFVKYDDKYFYGSRELVCPATLTDLNYSNLSLAQKATVNAFFGNSEVFRGEGSKTVKFTVFSDFHYKQGMYATSIADLKEIYGRAEEFGSDFVLSAGDFCNDFIGSPELTNAFLGYEKADGSTMLAYNIYGNHELEAHGSMQIVTPTLTNDQNVVWGTADGKMGDGSIGYYYFDNNGIRFINIDTNYSWNPTKGAWEHNVTNSYGPASGNTKANSLGPEQLTWLEELLYASADEGIPCVIVSHATLCPSWMPSSDAQTTHKLFKEVNLYRPGTVILQVSGHEHNDRQEILDGIYYLGINTVKNGLWVGGSVEHYTGKHTFQMETYDSQGNFTGYVTKGYGELGMGANTWFFETPLSTNITISQNGQVYVEGMETDWVYDVEPDPDLLYSTDPWSHPYITETYNFTVFGDLDQNRTFDDMDIALTREIIIGKKQNTTSAADPVSNSKTDICDLVYLKRRLEGKL